MQSQTKKPLLKKKHIAFTLSLTLVVLNIRLPRALASISSTSPVTVGATYYGGHFDTTLNKWVIDNQNQCSRIANGELSAQSLNAVVSSNCNDDNGLGYLNDTPLHNTVSFAELSNNATNPDWSALGGLPSGTKLEIGYKGKCLVASKLDVGQGGGPIKGYTRSIDLWWQTARAIGFYNGYDTVSIKKVDQSTPLSALGSSYTCQGTIATPSSGVNSSADTQNPTINKKRIVPNSPTQPPSQSGNPTDANSLVATTQESNNLSAPSSTVMGDSIGNNDFVRGNGVPQVKNIMLVIIATIFAGYCILLAYKRNIWTAFKKTLSS